MKLRRKGRGPPDVPRRFLWACRTNEVRGTTGQRDTRIDPPKDPYTNPVPPDASYEPVRSYYACALTPHFGVPRC
jgi:hypothetical protein